MKEFFITLITMPSLIIIIYLLGVLASKPKTKIKFFSYALGFAFLFSFPFVTKILGYPLIALNEKINESNKNNVNEVIILTGGIYKNILDQWIPSRSTHNRVLLAKKFIKNGTYPIIISGGFTEPNAPSEATIARNFYDLYSSILEENSLNTYQSAVNLKEYCSKKNMKFLLIAGKYHSLRSYLTFKTQGCNVIMHNYNIKIKIKDFIPNLTGYSNFNNIVYEYLGLTYYLVTLKINLLKI